MELFKEFSTYSKSEWLEKVKKDLKSKPIESLDWTLEGKSYSPFYHSDDLEATASTSKAKAQNNWWLTQSITVTDPKEANKKAIDALKGGCNALTFLINGENKIELNKLLKDIQLEWIFTEFVLTNFDSLVFSEKLLTYTEGRGFDTENIHGAVYEQKVIKQIEMLEERIGLFPLIKMIKIKSQDHSSITEELSNILLKTKNHLKRHPNKKALSEILSFELSMTDHYFSNIAKIRSLRLLIQNIFNAYEIKNCQPFISINIDCNDPNEDENYNIIRANAQTASAISGGADLLKIQKLIHSNGENFGQRISRNISHLLQQESYMDRVKDPLSGSYFIEKLTDDICESAWAHFQNR